MITMLEILFQQICKAVLQIAKPNSESVDDCDDIPLNKKDVVWK